MKKIFLKSIAFLIIVATLLSLSSCGLALSILLGDNSDIGKIEETVQADLQGKELKIAMNGKYLLDAIKALEEEEITLSFNSPVSPFTVENQIDKRYQYLILPVRTSNSAQ